MEAKADWGRDRNEHLVHYLALSLPSLFAVPGITPEPCNPKHPHPETRSYTRDLTPETRRLKPPNLAHYLTLSLPSLFAAPGIILEYVVQLLFYDSG